MGIRDGYDIPSCIQLVVYGYIHNSANFIKLKLFPYKLSIDEYKTVLKLALANLAAALTIKLTNMTNIFRLDARQIIRSYKVSSDTAMVRRSAA
ncbi:MAG: hypothetical protein ACJ704_13520 [Nitrososphaeraceae archaeon]